MRPAPAAERPGGASLAGHCPAPSAARTRPPRSASALSRALDSFQRLTDPTAPPGGFCLQ